MLFHFYNMKKTILFVVSLFCLILATSSCNDRKTAQEMLKEEKKAIQRFISRNGIKLLSEYPENGVFGENEYFRTSGGLYIHVVDSGNGTRAKLYNEVLVRFSGLSYFKNDTSIIKPVQVRPYEFIYGNSNSYDDLGCDGWAIPLQYVGLNAVVNLIIPSSLGNYSDRLNYRPIYYERLKYTAFN